MFTFVSFSFAKNKTKSLFIPWGFGSIEQSKYGFVFLLIFFDRYSFQLIVLLKPNFNASSSFPLSWVDKVISGKWSFVGYCQCLFSCWITQVGDQGKIRLISSLEFFIIIFCEKNILKKSKKVRAPWNGAWKYFL